MNIEIQVTSDDKFDHFLICGQNETPTDLMRLMKEIETALRLDRHIVQRAELNFEQHTDFAEQNTKWVGRSRFSRFKAG